MKITGSNKEGFRPITITIFLETEEEADTLYNLVNCSNAEMTKISDGLLNGIGQKMALRELFRELWVVLWQYGVKSK